MTDAPVSTPEPAVKPNLDIGGILSSTFKVFSGQFFYFFAIIFFPYLAIQLIFNFGFGLAAMGADPFIMQSDNVVTFFALTAALGIVLWLSLLMVQAIMVRSAVSVKLGRGIEFGHAFRAGLAGLIPILLLGLVAGLATAVGFLLLIVPAFYVMAMFYVLIPVVVFENKGFGGLGRSVELTSGYRWSLVGLILVLALIGMFAGLIIALFSGIVVGVLAASGGDLVGLQSSPIYLLILTLLDALVNSIIYPISMIAAAMAYLRLREIKEGGETGELLKVFE